MAFAETVAPQRDNNLQLYIDIGRVILICMCRARADSIPRRTATCQTGIQLAKKALYNKRRPACIINRLMRFASLPNNVNVRPTTPTVNCTHALGLQDVYLVPYASSRN